ncbi:MAG: hypothetical protein AB7E31_02580 [Desulfitobacterium sp.]
MGKASYPLILVVTLKKFLRKAANILRINTLGDLFAYLSKEFSPSIVFRWVWETLGLDKILVVLFSERELSIDVQDAVFAWSKSSYLHLKGANFNIHYRYTKMTKS